MDQYARFAFNGEARCFIHVLLNGLDPQGQRPGMKIVIEGAASRLIPELGETINPLHRLYTKARAQGRTSLEDMSGHAGMAPFILDGYWIITF